MGKQYISTVNASQAHDSDVLGVTITDKYTISISSDGYLKFWDNKQPNEVHNPKEFVYSVLVNDIGIHHIACFENKLPSSTTKLTLLALGCFDGKVIFKYYVNDAIVYIKDWPGKFEACWVPQFYHDPESKQDYFIVTKTTGTTVVYHLNVSEDNGQIAIAIEEKGELNPGTNTFPNALAVCPTKNKKLAIGYTNGDVLIYDFQQLKLIYTFHSPDLTIKSASSVTTSIPRVLEFSPGGTLLAVARDNQSSGTITLYDVDHGENVGTLTSSSNLSQVGGFAHQGWIMGLSFDQEGKLLASGGFDKCVRVWNLETGEREATITVSVNDLEDDVKQQQNDTSVVSGVRFINKGVRGGLGGDSNEGLCVVSFDRGIRWYREAGGI
ncbi:Antiviral protein SKI8 [Spathaspora sp. JA1]|nr:Antiviral protein SKI8 [Spathaspora sp. JA1]